MNLSDFGVGKHVIVRTYSAGVHYGTLQQRKKRELILTNSRRIHYWEGAFTLTAIALDGASEASRLSASIPEILLTEAIEVIPCSEESVSWFASMPAHGKDDE